MGDFISAMGIMSLPLVICSFVAIAAVVALFLSLKREKVIPESVSQQAQQIARSGKVSRAQIENMRKDSILGRVLASGLENLNQPRHLVKDSIEEAGRHAAHSMDRFMTALGTIATIAPLLGLLGTVVGMIEVFGVITAQGVGSPTELAGGIKTALYTTAVGIVIAVIALIFHRYFRGKINDYAVEMEKEALKLLSAIPAVKPAVAKRPAARPAAATRAASAQKPAAKAAGRVA